MGVDTVILEILALLHQSHLFVRKLLVIERIGLALFGGECPIS